MVKKIGIKVPEERIGELHHYLRTTKISCGLFGSDEKIGLPMISLGGGTRWSDGARIIQEGYDGFKVESIKDSISEDGTYLTFSGTPNHHVKNLTKLLELAA